MIPIIDLQRVFVFVINTFTASWNLMLSYWPLTFLLMLNIINSIVKHAKKLLGK